MTDVLTIDDETYEQLAGIGLELLRAVMVTDMLRHSNPSEMRDYTKGVTNFAIDYTDWCCRRSGWEEARTRCVDRVRALGIQESLTAILGRALTPAKEER